MEPCSFASDLARYEAAEEAREAHEEALWPYLDTAIENAFKNPATGADLVSGLFYCEPDAEDTYKSGGQLLQQLSANCITDWVRLLRLAPLDAGPVLLLSFREWIDRTLTESRDGERLVNEAERAMQSDLDDDFNSYAGTLADERGEPQ